MLSAAPRAIDLHEFAALEALDMVRKSQLLDWLEDRRQTASIGRKVG